MKAPDLIPEKIVLRGRDNGDVVRIAPYFVKPARPFRGVEISLTRPPRVGPPRFHLSAEEEVEFEKCYPPLRLKKFAKRLVEQFGIDPKALRVRGRRGSHQLYIHLWEGPGAAADYEKLRAVMKYIEKHAGEI